MFYCRFVVLLLGVFNCGGVGYCSDNVVYCDFVFGVIFIGFSGDCKRGCMLMIVLMNWFICNLVVVNLFMLFILLGGVFIFLLMCIEGFFKLFVDIIII